MKTIKMTIINHEESLEKPQYNMATPPPPPFLDKPPHHFALPLPLF